jgi:hypothetical protein
MEIAGRYGEYSIIIRCCPKGKWHITTPTRGSGCIGCDHLDENGKGGYVTYYDYLNISKLKYVKDKNIIKEALEPDPSPTFIIVPKKE